MPHPDDLERAVVRNPWHGSVSLIRVHAERVECVQPSKDLEVHPEPRYMLEHNRSQFCENAIDLGALGDFQPSDAICFFDRLERFNENRLTGRGFIVDDTAHRIAAVRSDRNHRSAIPPRDDFLGKHIAREAVDKSLQIGAETGPCLFQFTPCSFERRTCRVSNKSSLVDCPIDRCDEFGARFQRGRNRFESGVFLCARRKVTP
ncbi:MAG: hypothetical protein BWY06_01258 [Candidatus Latescibacteria bacterium ADurb.Bin168]|nr:MAG: hypothetical protein BWY06_01258 [Candidatus Latescibacteria bacterium ADurb.Bin168]